MSDAPKASTRQTAGAVKKRHRRTPEEIAAAGGSKSKRGSKITLIIPNWDKLTKEEFGFIAKYKA